PSVVRFVRRQCNTSCPTAPPLRSFPAAPTALRRGDVRVVAGIDLEIAPAGFALGALGELAEHVARPGALAIDVAARRGRGALAIDVAARRGRFARCEAQRRFERLERLR